MPSEIKPPITSPLLTSITLDIPASAEARERRRLEGWNVWYETLPADLRRKLSLDDFKRLGEAFKGAFNVG